MPAQKVTIKIVVSALIGALFLIGWSQKTYAIFTMSIKEVDRQSIDQKEQEIKVVLGINNLPSESYLRASFQKKNGDPYFGFMKNDLGSWTKIGSLSSDCKGYYNVTDKTINEISIPLIIGADTNVESGDYLIKGHRFTSSCSSYDESTNSASINFSFPSPSPSASPSPAASPSPTPSLSPSSSPTPIPSKSPSPKPSPSPEESLMPELATPTGEVLGENEASPPAETKKKNSFTLSFVLIGLGTALLATTGIVFYNQRHEGKI